MQPPRVLCNPFIVLAHAWQALTDACGGAIIECGSFDGMTSAVLNFGLRKHLQPFRQYAADTFAGFPYDGKANEKYRAGDLHPYAGIQVVSDLRRLGIIALCGKVEDTLVQLEHERFAFAFLDLDIEAPTRCCWEFLRKRMRPGARVGFHDYGSASLPGIKKIVDEILAGKQWVEVYRPGLRRRDNRFVFIKRFGGKS